MGKQDAGTKAEETISREATQQYEWVRRLGAVNMFDRVGVKRIAMAHGHLALAELADDRDEYALLLANYAHLIEAYGIEG